MVDILHRIGTTTSREEVYDALTTVEGLSGWWTRETSGESEVGGILRFRFHGVPMPDGFDMKVLENEPAERVRWEVVDGPKEWIGTRIVFELKQEDAYTIVLFRHEGWKEPGEFMHHCSTKWATFLMSLKKLLETGKGEPAPDDVRISNWH
ncbi:SRPBCC domain-containing protein [Streptomyces sp. TRM66268-LWL]|uniref:SRPBCC domain-containing protein n=1 Tax=Streptomyces polyasparticus TaxID=2767826 RepID=A0ABR7SDN3_9ACTN|nr:SRPBCC domain-containing protein [Streptomyces polyasparticus]MBC9713523.1 SRPBCC domain-containing protein [Streptomyces polyasparticus]